MRYQVRFNPPLGKPVELGDTLIVLGEDAKLDALMANLETTDSSAAGAAGENDDVKSTYLR